MRSEKSPEIQFKRSFFKFSFVFIVSLILGLVGRFFIYSQPLDEIVSQKISDSEKYEIDVEGVQIKLRQGWMPAFAVFAKTISVVDSSCAERSLIASDIFVSMDLISLLQNKVQTKSVFVTKAHLKTPEKCTELQKEKPSSEEKPAPTVSVKKERKKEIGSSVPQKIFSIFKEDAQALLPPFFDINDFQVDLYREGRLRLSFHGEMGFRNSAEGMVANIYTQDVKFRGEELPVNRGLVSLSLSENIFSARYETYIREGKVNVSLQVENDKSFPVKLSGKLTKIPISTFSRFLFKETQFNYLWVNCETSLQAPWKEVKGTFFSLDQCHLSGPYGTAKVIQSETSFERLKNLEVEFSKVDLDQVIKSKRNIYFSGIFSRFGSLSGVLNHTKGRWNLKAMLENSDVIFSRNNLRELQKMTKLPFKVSSNGSGWHMSVSGVELDKGVIGGKIDFYVDEKMENGRGKVALHQVQLRPRIYKLMLQSEPSNFSLFGDVEFADGKISGWRGALATARVLGEKFAFAGLKVEAHQEKGGEPLLKIVSREGHFAKESEVLSWLKPTVLGEVWMDGEAKFKELSVKFSLKDKEKWLWKRGYMRFAKGWQLSTEGSLASKGDLQGWMQWDIPKKTFSRWTYSGSFKKGKWTPEEKWMKEWLDSNPKHLKDYPRIDFVADNKSEVTEDVKAMGKKILEKAKSVLPLETKSKNKGS